MNAADTPNGILACALLLFVALQSGCGPAGSGGTTIGNPEDSSASGTVAAVVGGSLSGSGSGGTLAFLERKPRSPWMRALELIPEAWASVSCPTFKTTGSGCAASGESMWLTYSDCSFGLSEATWVGTQLLEMGSGSAACGTFPYPGANEMLYRQFVASSGSTSPSSASETSAFGTLSAIRDGDSNLGNYASDTISTIVNGGYGVQVDFGGTGGSRSQIVLGHRLVIGSSLDHSVSGTLDITETFGASSRTVSGTVLVYHNLLKVLGTATFSGLVHTDTCCLPTSGTITTTFSSHGPSPSNAVEEEYVGKTETLKLTGCGTGTLTTVDGATESVTLSRCF